MTSGSGSDGVRSGTGAACGRYAAFVRTCLDGAASARLTPRADPSPFALCFAVFGLHLSGERDTLDRHGAAWSQALREAVRQTAQQRAARVDLKSDKHFLQLLTFCLSALKVLGHLDADPLADVVLPLLPTDVPGALRAAGADRGVARSGNQAMFIAILLLHARRGLGQDTDAAIADWVRCHRQWMNRFGFWGPDDSMSHLQFQNGYHQYEILEYLGEHGDCWDRAADAVATLADAEGHFAPYPGGGGCYDYDAVFLLTASPAVARRHVGLLERTAATLLAEQNPDGGFAESLRVRPRSFDNLRRSWRHVRAATDRARVERLHQALTLLRPRHDRINTHWSRYSRGWSESDLWDSWFRMLALARIECAIGPAPAHRWGFIDFPGIGFHPSAKDPVRS
jgi:hypothetical protein